MRALRDVDLRKLHAPMPAAMLPCPAPAGSDWSFQNPVGVDCSSPEPRCIWLAVLRSAAGSASPSMPPAMPTGHGQRLHPPRVRTDHPSPGRQSQLFAGRFIYSSEILCLRDVRIRTARSSCTSRFSFLTKLKVIMTCMFAFCGDADALRD